MMRDKSINCDCESKRLAICSMVRLETQSHFRPVQRLPFCYLCGQAFAARKDKNRDHAPPKCTFAEADREPLILPTHVACNRSYELLEEKVGQLTALRRREVTGADHDRLGSHYRRI
jgi:hypothetical protein